MSVVLTGIIIILGTIIIIGSIEHKKMNTEIKYMLKLGELRWDLGVSIQLEKLITHTISIAKQMMQAENCILYLWDANGEQIYSDLKRGEQQEDKIQEFFITAKETATLAMNKSITINMKKNKDMILALPIQTGKKNIGVLEFINKKDGGKFTKEDEKLMMYLIEIQIAPNIEKSKLYERLRMTFVDSIEAMVSAIDAKDEYTQGHCRRVSQNAVKLGKDIGLEEESLEQLEYTGILHDIGKIGIKDTILNKTGPLNEDEYDIMKTHPIVGANIVSQITTLNQSVSDGVRYHHERYDGTGYCEHLKGDEIPLFARIIAIADTYDAMTTDRVYRDGFSKQAALEEIRKGAGKQFDPYLVTMFIRAMMKEESLNKTIN
ncbi:MAG: GAF and HD-GYP domain-containing protein [Cellulosilyticaceae bacterium]